MLSRYDLPMMNKIAHEDLHSSVEDRLARLDWPRLSAALDAGGFATIAAFTLYSAAGSVCAKDGAHRTLANSAKAALRSRSCKMKRRRERVARLSTLKIGSPL